MKIEREEFLNEAKQEEQLREQVRRAITIFFKRQRLSERKVKKDEDQLRGLIQQMLKEGASTDVPGETPHKSTGINVLEDLLKKIIPILEDDFKALTSSEEQRKSFRAHVIQAVVNSLTPDNVNQAAIVKEDLDITVDDTDGEDGEFIDIDPEPEEETDPRDEFGIEGEDTTGRNFAYQSYNKIEKVILDAYETLGDHGDRELFYDYLLTNLKLYFNKFEDELKTSINEPTTDAYEKEVSNQEPAL
jgi:hypothetical protein